MKCGDNSTMSKLARNARKVLKDETCFETRIEILSFIPFDPFNEHRNF